jgi:ABC-type nitrate/sulfonate/bicarbonate transport system substrate-binding protein
LYRAIASLPHSKSAAILTHKTFIGGAFLTFSTGSTDTVELLLPLNVVATSRRFVRENPDAVRKYIKSHVEAIHLMQTDRESGVRMMAKFFKATKDLDILKLSYDQTATDKVIPLKQIPRIEGIKTVLDIWTEEEPLAANAKPEQFLDLRFIKELDESGFIANLAQRK